MCIFRSRFLKLGRKYVFAGNDELLEAGVSSPRGSELRLQVGQEIQDTVRWHFSCTNSTCSSILLSSVLYIILETCALVFDVQLCIGKVGRVESEGCRKTNATSLPNILHLTTSLLVS